MEVSGLVEVLKVQVVGVEGLVDVLEVVEVEGVVDVVDVEKGEVV